MPLVVDLGCGGVIQDQGAIGVDRLPSEAVDVLADLADPLPFRDRVIDRIYAVHVLEHVPDMLDLLNVAGAPAGRDQPCQCQRRTGACDQATRRRIVEHTFE
ncbi:MAG TPA: hypothetical protein VEL73_01665 [Mycobacteriales bacterium]|nr:hypothetical protein [Mycobacteriales bacterium]